MNLTNGRTTIDVPFFTLRVSLALGLGICASIPGRAQKSAPTDLTQVSLEDLMNVKVTSVSKKEQRLSRAGAAVYVIDQEDIRRSGATTIPDLLRMAPGVDVARIDANTWAISIRGFTDRYANKVLVLIDGRSVYSPAFSGVFWDGQDVPLEDIERIELIRGPGGTVWGANAVNGVINIITKRSKDTRGGIIAVGGGSETTADGLVQYGGAIGSKGTYRVFGRYWNIDRSIAAGGGEAADAWHAPHGGFRSDWDLSPRDTMTVQGDFQNANEGQTITTLFSNALPLERTLNDPVAMRTGNVLGRWNHSLVNGSDMSLQVYDAHYRRVNQGIFDSQNTVDLDFQHHLAIGSRQDMVWGLGSRVTNMDFGAGYAVTFVPLSRTDLLFSTFIQDEVKIADSLWLTIGSKFEHNSYTGFEFEPSAQLVWTLPKEQAIWVSGARAIRQPNPVDAGLRVDEAIVPVPGAPFGVVTVSGSPNNLTAETLRDFEAGYRAQIGKRLSLDLAAFSSFYADLQTVEPSAPYFTANPEPPHLVLPLVFANKAHAHTYGVELFVNWSVTKRWRISPGYSTLHMAVTRYSSSQDSTVQQIPGNTPEHQFQLRSFLSLPHNLEWDNTLAYVGRRPNGDIPAYTRLDTRLGWRAGESLEFSVAGQNLLGPRHVEFPDAYGLDHTQIERSVFGKVTWRF